MKYKTIEKEDTTIKPIEKDIKIGMDLQNEIYSRLLRIYKNLK